MIRSRPLIKLLDLVLIAAGFAGAVALYRFRFPQNYVLFTPAELFAGFAISVLTFWLIVRLYETGGRESSRLALFDQFCLSTGLNLALQALLNYFQLLTRSLFLIVIGGLLALLFLAIARQWIYGPAGSSRTGVLMIGFSPIAHQLADLLRQPIVGVIGASRTGVPSGVPWWGDARQLGAIDARLRPAHILVASAEAAAGLSASELLQCRLAGAAVEDVPGLYEKLFRRVYCESLGPADLVLSPGLRADSRTMAFQAIYTNLIGLLLLLALSPVLVAVTLAVAVFSGRGPTFESAEYAGFQNIPFRLLRFRTLRTDGSGLPTRVGRWIARLHLVHLPGLINIVRGEMALFGPRPARREFAQRLAEVIPLYAVRSSVKPGILGWAQMHLRGAPAPPCEILQIGYDLYYIKRASLLLDPEILIRTLAGSVETALPSTEYAGAAP